MTVNVAFPVEKSFAFHATASLFPFAKTKCTMGAFPSKISAAQYVFSGVAYLPCSHSSHVVRPGEFAMLFPGQDWQPLTVPFFPTEHFEQLTMPRNSVVSPGGHGTGFGVVPLQNVPSGQSLVVAHPWSPAEQSIG